MTIAFESWERVAESSLVIGAVMLTLGLLLNHSWRVTQTPSSKRFSAHLEAAVFLVEATVFALIAGGFFEHGKKLLPWLYVGLVIVYAVLAAVRFARRHSFVTH